MYPNLRLIEDRLRDERLSATGIPSPRDYLPSTMVIVATVRADLINVIVMGTPIVIVINVPKRHTKRINGNTSVAEDMMMLAQAAVILVVPILRQIQKPTRKRHTVRKDQIDIHVEESKIVIDPPITVVQDHQLCKTILVLVLELLRIDAHRCILQVLFLQHQAQGFHLCFIHLSRPCNSLML
jgi:hypothetical protein